VLNEPRARGLLAICVVALTACSGPPGLSPDAVTGPPVARRSVPGASPVEEAKSPGVPSPLALVEPALRSPAKPLFGPNATVPYRAFVEEMRRVADGLTTAPEVERSYRALLADYDLRPGDVSMQSYSRVRLVFEATRDGGLWGLKWAITNRMPWSDAIWQQWRVVDFQEAEPDVTAIAECDELSALFSLLARDVGIQGFVGLHWPAWNHTVAVWEVRRGATENDPGVGVRMMVPTSQIWLSREATLGSREFSTGRVVFPYARQDRKPDSEIPVALARFLIERLERYGALSTEALLERRQRFGGS
jgi:hypothetical protein